MEITWNFNPSGNTTLDHQDIGLSIIPVSTSKKPFKPWARYQKEIAGFQDWHQHYVNQDTVGIITGQISGNLECLDIDVKNDPRKTIMTEFSDKIPDALLGKLLIQSTPNNGFHIIYRCPGATIDGNTRLALHSDKAVIM
jgi:bifunctional DNA primase/polymerase-like protein